MTETPPTHRSVSDRRKPALHRTVLGIVVAALVAAWLPFSILYIDALSRHTAVVTTTTVPAIKSAPSSPTATSGGSAAASAPTAVTTRVS